MSVRITSVEGKVALFCSTTGWALGPVFDSDDEAEMFLEYCENVYGYDDIRRVSDEQLSVAYAAFVEAYDSGEFSVTVTATETEREE